MKALVAEIVDVPGGTLRVSFNVVVYDATGFIAKVNLDVEYSPTANQQQFRAIIQDSIWSQLVALGYNLTKNDVMFIFG